MRIRTRKSKHTPFSFLLRTFMRKRQLSATDIARLSNGAITPPRIHYWLHEGYHPRGDVINILAKVLELSPALLVAAIALSRENNQLNMDPNLSKEVDEILIRPIMETIKRG